MKASIYLILLFAAIVLFSQPAFAREGNSDENKVRSIASFNITDLSGSLTPADLASAMVGSGVSIANISYAGNELTAGTFSGGGSVIGIESGIVFSSGDVNMVAGPNVFDSLTTQHGLPGDADLDALIPQTTLDAVVLEFDFTPDANSVLFRYVFASEEYNEWVNTDFNDVFAFFINGTGADANCARVPNPAGGTLAVSVNTVNGGNPLGDSPTNAALYNNNDLSDGGGGLDTELDGFTDVLICQASVNANVTNNMKLALADAGDERLDSVIFIEASSLTSGDFSLVPQESTACPLQSSHTVTASLFDADLNPIVGATVAFEVIDGPNSGQTGTEVTDDEGNASFTFTGDASGKSTVVATFEGASQELKSNTATVTWQCQPTDVSLSFVGGVDGDRNLPIVLGTLIALIAGAALFLRRRSA